MTEKLRDQQELKYFIIWLYPSDKKELGRVQTESPWYVWEEFCYFAVDMMRFFMCFQLQAEECNLNSFFCVQRLPSRRHLIDSWSDKVSATWRASQNFQNCRDTSSLVFLVQQSHSCQNFPSPTAAIVNSFPAINRTNRINFKSVQMLLRNLILIK